MSRNDSTHTQQLAANEVLLYLVANPERYLPDALPAPDMARLKQCDLPALTGFLAALFPPRPRPRRTNVKKKTPTYPVHFSRDRASIFVDIGTTTSMNCTIPQLIEEATRINPWLREWADSAEHIPSLTPAWALALGLCEADVQAIAYGISNWVARAEEVTFLLRDSELHECTISIPPRAKLQGHTETNDNKTKQVDIGLVDNVRTGMTAGGQPTILTGDVSNLPSTGEVTVDSSKIHRTSILVPKYLKVSEPTSINNPEEQG